MTTGLSEGLLRETPRVPRDVFAKEPVPLKTFLYDKGYLKQPDLSEVQFDAVRHLETIYLPATEAMLCEDVPGWGPPVRLINFAAIQWGKGSGKDHICGLVLARWVYLLLCLQNPLTYYGKAPQSHIHFLNVASSAGQASRAFFDAFRELIKSAPVFRGQYALVTGANSRGVGEPGKYEIHFHKHIDAISGHSGSASQEGLNLLGAIADEISEFRTKAEVERTTRSSSEREPRGTADSVLKMMRTSGRTRFPETFKNAAISFPRFKDDAIQQLTARGLRDIEKHGENSTWYVSGPLATWDVNPTVPGKEAFQEDYDEDAAMAEAMYECNPGRATNRVYRNDNAIAAAFSRPSPIKPLDVAYYWGTDDTPIEDESGLPQEKDGWQARFLFQDLWPYTGCLYALHGDMAISGDRAGIAMAHVKNWQTGDWDGVHGLVHEARPIVKVDFVLALEADTGAQPVAREVQLRWFRKLVWQLVSRGFPIGWVSLDGWQSADSLQIMESRGIEAEKLSCDIATTPVWGTLKDVMYDGRLDGPMDQELIDEIASLRLLLNKKVDHPDGGSKDLADAVAGAVYGALQAGGSGEGEAPERADQATIDMFGLGSPRKSSSFALDMDDLGIESVDLTPPT